MQRRLAAILASDIVGYSRMMGADETGTLEAIRRLKSEHLNPAVSGHGGQVVKSMGDGWLVEFPSVLGAIRAAMRLQDGLADRPITLRIGVHMGDITEDEDDIYGDGINIAARLEGFAEPGGIAISDTAYNSLDGTLAPSFDDQGEQTLKNIARPIRVWTRSPMGSALTRMAPTPDVKPRGFPRLMLNPVTTSDPRGEVQDLAAALTSDLHTYFGPLSWLVTQVSETAQGSGYRLSLALRARGDRLRLEVRLHTPDQSISWSAKFDSTLDESFEWQDEVGEAVAASVITAVLDGETRRLASTPQADLSAEQCLLAGMMAWRSYSPESFVEALTYHKRAIDLDPDAMLAYGEAIMVTIAGKTVGYHDALAPFAECLPGWRSAAARFAGRNATIDCSLGLAQFMEDGDAETFAVEVSEILRRAPFDPRVLCFGGWSYVWAGKAEKAEDCFRAGLRFGRFGPYYVASLGGIATVCVQTGRPEEALTYCALGIERGPEYATLHTNQAAAFAMLDRMDEARAAMDKSLALAPRTLSSWKAYNDYGGSEGGARYFAALKKAGMPE